MSHDQSLVMPGRLFFFWLVLFWFDFLFLCFLKGHYVSVLILLVPLLPYIEVAPSPKISLVESSLFDLT